MISLILTSFLLTDVLSMVRSTPPKRYEPTWASLDARPLPTWYDEAKFGIFLHWGVFSVPSFGGAWFWHDWHNKNPADIAFMQKNYRPGFTYADFAAEFRAELYDPDHWADIFEASGARYVVLTSKHHEGFCNWPSKVSFNWNAMDVGPRRDLVGDLAAAIRNRTKLHFGVYHSLFEWFNPIYLQDKSNHYKTQKFVAEKTIPELYELIHMYKPDVVWSDGAWEAPSPYWNSTEFIAWLYNDSPVRDTVVINDRWGSDTPCKHGGVYTCQDRYNLGHLLKHKWENCMTVDKSFWAFRRNMDLADILDIKDLIKLLAETVSCGGNLLMNVGPTADGRIIPIFEERLRQMGAWLKVNGEAIYSSQPWSHQNDTAANNIWYTSKPGSIYAIVLEWPSSGQLHLGAPHTSHITVVTMLGVPAPLKWHAVQTGGIQIIMPALSIDDVPSQWAWVLKMTNLI